MIAKQRAKGVIAQLIAVAAGLAVLGALALAGQVALYSLTGAQTSQALKEIPEVPEDAEDHVNWRPDRWTGERVLEIGTRRQIEAVYVQAWEALGRYPETGDRSQVEQLFAGPARQQVIAIEPTFRRAIWGIHFQPALTFYDLGGTTVAIQDEDATVVRSLQTEHGETTVTSLETYDSVFTLEDGYWRIRQFRKIRSQPLVEVSSTGVSADAPGQAGSTGQADSAGQAADPPGMRAQTLLDRATAESRRPAVTLAEPLRTVDLPIEWVAAVPAATDGTPAQPESFDRPQLEADLRASAAAGLNSVRITLPATEFGAVPSETGLALVSSAMDRAQAHGLRVEVTIDGPGTNRTPRTWNQGDRRLAAVVAALGNHPALALWNLAQAPEATATPDVQMRAWLVRAALTMRTLGTQTPVTIGWQTPAAAADPAMIGLVDLVTLPWRDRPELLDGWLAELTRLAGDRPLRLAPTAHSWNSIWPGGRTENEQATWTATVVQTATAYELPHLLTGPLRDSSTPAPSRLPWAAGPATHTGLLRADGTPKPVVGAISPALAAQWPAANRNEELHKPFWRVAAVLILLSVPGVRSGIWRGVRRLRGHDAASDAAKSAARQARKLREREIREHARQEAREARVARKARARADRDGSVDLRDHVLSESTAVLSESTADPETRTEMGMGTTSSASAGGKDGGVAVVERSIGFTIGWLIGRIFGRLSRIFGR